MYLHRGSRDPSRLRVRCNLSRPQSRPSRSRGGPDFDMGASPVRAPDGGRYAPTRLPYTAAPASCTLPSRRGRRGSEACVYLSSSSATPLPRLISCWSSPIEPHCVAAASSSTGIGMDVGGQDKLKALTFQRLHPKTYLERFLAENVRPDSREFDEWRDISVNVGQSHEVRSVGSWKFE